MMSPEERRRISAESKARWADPEYRRRMSEKMKRQWENPEFREQMSRHLGRQTPARKKHLESLHADPVLVEKRKKNLRAANIVRYRKQRGFDLPPDLVADYKLFQRKLGNSAEAARVLGLKSNE